MENSKLKEAVADARKRKLEGQEAPATFVSGDVAPGVVRDAEVQREEPEDEKPEE